MGCFSGYFWFFFRLVLIVPTRGGRIMVECRCVRHPPRDSRLGIRTDGGKAVKKTRGTAAGWRLQTLRATQGRRRTPEASGLEVWVSLLGAEAERYGLTRERLLAEVEYRLARSGIPLREPGAPRQLPDLPCLGVMVQVQTPPGDPTWPFDIEMFYLGGSPAKGPWSRALHLEWCREARGVVHHHGREVNWQPLYEDLGCLLEEFLGEHQILQAELLPSWAAH